MKASAWKKGAPGLALAICFVILYAPGVMALNIEYTGDTGDLQAEPPWGVGSSNSALFPGSTANPSASGNTIGVDYSDSADAPEIIYGGLIQNGTAENNAVNIVNAAAVNEIRVYGGYSREGAAGGNTVTISEGDFNALRVHGGYSEGGSDSRTSGNRVEISGGDMRSGYAYFIGARSGAGGSANDNTVIIGKDVNFYGTFRGVAGAFNGAAGGNAINGSADRNTVSVSSGTATAAINNTPHGFYGGTASVSRDDLSATLFSASGNAVTLGGSAGASRNDIEDLPQYNAETLVAGGQIKLSYATAKGHSFEVADNKVVIGTTGTFSSLGIYGGDVKATAASVSGLAAADMPTFELSGNSVEFKGGTFDGGGRGSIYGARWRLLDAVDNMTVNASAVVKDNTVTISGGTVNGSVYGADFTFWKDGGGAPVGVQFGDSGFDVANNSILITGGKAVKESATDELVGGWTFLGDATGNEVTITGGTVEYDAVCGGFTMKGDATGNAVSVTRGDVAIEQVQGGYAVEGDAVGNSVYLAAGTYTDVLGGISENGKATGNIVTLAGAVDVSGANVFGGYDNSLGHEVRAGNTLRIVGYKGAALGVHNFEKYDFVFTSAIGDGDVMLDVTDFNPAELQASTVTLSAEGKLRLKAGDEVTLLRNIDNFAGIAKATTNFDLGLLAYDFTLLERADGGVGSLVASLDRVGASAQSKSLPMGRIGGMALLNLGGDLIADTAFAGLGQAFEGMELLVGWTRPVVFAGARGGHLRHKTRSHVDVDGVASLFGLGLRHGGPSGTLLAGAFFEYGYGDYDSHNSFANAASVRGDGDSRYYGGGLLARFDWSNGFYAEASGRVGEVRTKFHTDGILAIPGRTSYKSTATYYGAHAGLGYAWDWCSTSFDVSTKYLWSHQNSDGVAVGLNDVDFRATNSHRWRTGARATFMADRPFSPYAGAAFEYEFAGKARASVDGYAIDAPELKGASGMAELGVRYVAPGGCGFFADAGVQGYVGRRRGVTGSVKFGWRF